jgi:Major Facilitator Superfamily
VGDALLLPPRGRAGDSRGTLDRRRQAPGDVPVRGPRVRGVERARAAAPALWAIIAAVAPLGAVLGPAAGGILAGTLGWRAAFLVNLPMCLAAAWIGQRALPSRSHGGGRFPLPGSLLLRETVLLGVSVIALLLTLDRLSGTRFDGLVLALPVVAVLAFSAWRRLPGSRRVTELALG